MHSQVILPGGAEVLFVELARTSDELPEGVRLRIALDVMEQLVDDTAVALGPRTASSRLRLPNIRVAESGRARVAGSGDASGFQLLLWELLAVRETPAGALPRVHDVVDEIHPDVDEVVARAAIHHSIASAEELLESLREAVGDRAAAHAEVAKLVAGLRDPERRARESASAPTAPSAAVAAPRDRGDGATSSHRVDSTRRDRPVDRAPSLVSPPAAPVKIEEAAPATTAKPAVAGPVLVIAADDAGELVAAIEAAGNSVLWRRDTKQAAEAVEASRPSCIVLDIADGPDEDARALVRWMRSEASTDAAAIPLLLIAPATDEGTRLSGFLVGADVCVARPFQVASVVTQVAALVRMSSRLRTARTKLRSRSGQRAFEGNLAHVSIATLLAVLEMERRTGVFEVVGNNRRAALFFTSGFAMHGRNQGLAVSALGALQAMLGCDRGRFSFTPLPESERIEEGVGIGELLLEALRRRDEDARDADPNPKNSADNAGRS